MITASNGPEPEALQPEDEKRRDGGDDRRGEQADPEQQVEANRRAEELGQVGGHGDRLRLEPEPNRLAVGELLAAYLWQVAPGRDPQLRRQHLDQHRHQVRGDDHPQERETELRAARDVGREVARVYVGDAGDEGRTEERKQAKLAARVAAQHPLARAQGPVERFGSRSDHSESLA